MEKLWMDEQKAKVQASRACSDTAEVKAMGLSRYLSCYNGLFVKMILFVGFMPLANVPFNFLITM